MLASALLFYLNIQAADLLIQRGKWHTEALCRFGLVSVAALEHVGDDTALDVFDDLEQ